MLRFVLLAACLCCAESVSAAAVKAVTVGCRTEADARTLETMRAHGNADGFDALSQTKIAQAACATFARGTTITIETSKAPLMCVRLEGDLGCFWVPDRAISRESPAPEEHKTTGNRTLKF